MDSKAKHYFKWSNSSSKACPKSGGLIQWISASVRNGTWGASAQKVRVSQAKISLFGWVQCCIYSLAPSARADSKDEENIRTRHKERYSGKIDK